MHQDPQHSERDCQSHSKRPRPETRERTGSIFDSFAQRLSWGGTRRTGQSACGDCILTYTAVILVVLLVRFGSAVLKPMRSTDPIKSSVSLILQTLFWVTAYLALYFMAGRILASRRA